MRFSKLFLAIAAAGTAIGTIGAPTVSFGMECLQLCRDFTPQVGLLSNSTYGCQDLITDSGGTCTINGRMNNAMDLPNPGILYNKKVGGQKHLFYTPDTHQLVMK